MIRRGVFIPPPLRRIEALNLRMCALPRVHRYEHSRPGARAFYMNRSHLPLWIHFICHLAMRATSDVTAATCSSFPLPTYLPTLSARDDHQYAPTYLSRSSDHRQRVGLPGKEPRTRRCCCCCYREHTHTNTRPHHTDVASTIKGGVVTWDVSDATLALAHEFTRQPRHS